MADRLKMLAYRAQIHAETGHVVVSGWIDDKRSSSSMDNAQKRRVAEMNIADLGRSALCIGFCPNGELPGHGGRHFELGAAFANGSRIWVVGEREHVFHYLPGVCWFSSWSSAFYKLQRTREEDFNVQGG